MKYKYDYRSCVKISLEVFEKEREKLCADSSSEHNATIYNGLHEFESDNLRDLYFDAYITEWLDMHWNEMMKILDSHDEYKISKRREIILFFARYLSELVENCSETKIFTNIVVSDILKMKKKELDELIEDSEKWQKYAELLKADRKKHKEIYKRLMNRLKTERSNEK